MSWSTTPPGGQEWRVPSCRLRVDRSAAIGARTVDLTSRPDREAAHRLYLRMGFETRETSVYRKTLDAGER